MGYQSIWRTLQYLVMHAYQFLAYVLWLFLFFIYVHMRLWSLILSFSFAAWSSWLHGWLSCKRNSYILINFSLFFTCYIFVITKYSNICKFSEHLYIKALSHAVVVHINFQMPLCCCQILSHLSTKKMLWQKVEKLSFKTWTVIVWGIQRASLIYWSKLDWVSRFCKTCKYFVA